MCIRDSFSTVHYCICGIPWDGGTTNRPGARHGPREIRNASSIMRSINVSTGVEPFKLCSVADIGDVPIENLFNLEEVVAEITAYFTNICAAGAIPLSIGGDHSITYPILKGIASDQPVGVIHIDAHTDTWGEIWGSKFHHGSPFRLAVEDGLLDPKRTIQIGIRGAQNFMDGIDFSLDSGMRVVFMEEFFERGVKLSLIHI